MATWRDIDIFLRQKRNGDIADMSELDAIRNSLYNIFTTIPGRQKNVTYICKYNILFTFWAYGFHNWK